MRKRISERKEEDQQLRPFVGSRLIEIDDDQTIPSENDTDASTSTAIISHMPINQPSHQYTDR